MHLSLDHMRFENMHRNTDKFRILTCLIIEHTVYKSPHKHPTLYSPYWPKPHTHTRTHRLVLISPGVHSPAVLMCFYMKACSRTLIHDWDWMSLFITEAWGTRVSHPAPLPSHIRHRDWNGVPPPVIKPTISQRKSRNCCNAYFWSYSLSYWMWVYVTHKKYIYRLLTSSLLIIESCGQCKSVSVKWKANRSFENVLEI